MHPKGLVKPAPIRRWGKKNNYIG